MKKRTLGLFLLVSATVVTGTVRGTRELSAQVVRCWDVVCTIDGDGTMHCVETPKPCPTVT